MDLFLLFGLLAMGAPLYAVRFWDRRHAHPDWQRLPTRAEYLNAHPECPPGMSSAPAAMPVDRTRYWAPQSGWGDNRFRHTCLACGKALYRTEEPR
ncbi:hypothetical protein ACSZMP_13695 [Aeromonas rivipollensis]